MSIDSPAGGNVRLFIETPAGSSVRYRHDASSLEPLGNDPVPACYPYAYGFLPDFVSDDAECVDAYLVQAGPLDAAPGATMQARVVGLVEQWEAGEPDHKVLLAPLDAPEAVPDAVAELVIAFARVLYAGAPDGLVTVGPVRDRATALKHLEAFNIRAD